jgi:hypothetical protein
MGHYIQGFIAEASALREATSQLTNARCVPLRLGYSFLPITDVLAPETEDTPHDVFDRLTTTLVEWAQRTSEETPIAYIETDYHGGDGAQSSIVWSRGQCILGPLETVDGYQDGKVVDTPLLDGAINQAMRRLGVDRGDVRDEFDALGLGWNRSNDDWLNDPDPVAK